MNFLSTMLSGRDGAFGGSLNGVGANTSGSDTREDGAVQYGYSALQGKRPNMEDFTQV